MSDTRYKIRLWAKRNPERFDRVARSVQYDRFREQFRQASWVGIKWRLLAPVFFLGAIAIAFAFQFTVLRTLFAALFVIGGIVSSFAGMFLNYKADAPMWQAFLEVVVAVESEPETMVGTEY